MKECVWYDFENLDIIIIFECLCATTNLLTKKFSEWVTIHIVVVIITFICGFIKHTSTVDQKSKCKQLKNKKLNTLTNENAN